jgi:hypothetical protein
MRNRRSFRIAAGLAAFLSTLSVRPARAFFGADELKIYSPQVEKGELEFEGISMAAPHREQGHALAVGYGFTDYFELEAYQVYHRDPSSIDEPSPKLKADTAELEGRLRLTEPGRYWADIGLLAELELPHDSTNDPHELRLTPLIEKQMGDALFTLNIPFEWQYGTADGFNGTDLGVKLRAQYMVHPLFSPGIEYFSEEGVIGAMPALKDQTHSIGPAFFGRWAFSGAHAVRYRAAALFGLTPATPSWAVVTQLELEL